MTNTILVVLFAALFGAIVAYEKREWWVFAACLALALICGLAIYFEALGNVHAPFLVFG